MRRVLAPLLAFLMASLIFADVQSDAAKKKAAVKSASPAPKTAASAKKTPASTKKTGAVSKAGTAGKKAASRRTRKGSPAPQATWRSRQAAPTSARYRQIQDALVAKGYLSPEQADGKWSDTSADALKRFQADQNLEATGKITSLSLIALGLGPQYDKPASGGTANRTEQP
jgi:hypothetical protein